MAYRKYSADQLFDGFAFRETGSVLIMGDDGIVEDLLPADQAGDDIQYFNGIISPGFINCHGHLELSHLRGKIPESTGLVKFVIDVVQQRHYAEEIIYEAIEKAETEMLENGIVAAGDICNNTLTLPQKKKGRIIYHNFIEVSGYHPSVAKTRFDRSLLFFQEYAQHYSIPVSSNSLTPHAPYSVSDELWEMIIRFPGNQLFSIHNQETAGENEWFKQKTGNFLELYEQMKINTDFFNACGTSSLQFYLSKFLKNQQVILVHNVHTSGADIEFAKGSAINERLFWCLCPNANQYITGQLPDISMLAANGCRIVLGTDSLASNHQLSILKEIKTIRRFFPDIPVNSLLKWATRNGAEALELDEQLGSFEKGKNPGVLNISTDLQKVRRLL